MSGKGVQALLRRLDHVRPGSALAIGAAIGGVLGAGALLALPIGASGFVAVVAGFVALAFSGEPVLAGDDPWTTRREQLALPVARDPGALPPPMVGIPAGRFWMGSRDWEKQRHHDEGPVREVHVSAFHLMVFPVTRAQYAAVMGHDPGWPERAAGDSGDDGTSGEGEHAKPQADHRPANKVSWLDAMAFCNRLSEGEGLSPCYEIVGEDVRWNRAADGYRLPTEAEWEYACRAGTRTRFSFGDEEKELGDHAWYEDNSKGAPHPVGEKKPNGWGLHDMHGNVWEWCWDWYGAYPDPKAEPLVADPMGPVSGTARTLRGGSFAGGPRGLRCADRFRFEPRPKLRGRNVGFRCARGPRGQH